MSLPTFQTSYIAFDISLALYRPGKAASGANGACGHFVENHAILTKFWVKYPVLLSEDGGWRVDDG